MLGSYFITSIYILLNQYILLHQYISFFCWNYLGKLFYCFI